MANAARRILQAFTSSIAESAHLSQDERVKLTEAIRRAKEDEPAPTIAIIGESGVGKSSTINALFNAGEPVSAVTATTRQAIGMNIGMIEEKVTTGTGHLLQVFDMPGLGDDLRTYDQYRELYLEVLPRADVIVWVHPAYDRMVQFVQTALLDLFRNSMPQLASRLVFALNKADVIEPNDWNIPANVPSRVQMENLAVREREFAEKVRSVLPSWTGEAKAYSAFRRYQLPGLFKAMMYGMPADRRWVLEERMDIADFTALIDRRILSAAQGRMTVPLPEAKESSPPSENFATPSPGRPGGLPAVSPLVNLSHLPEDQYINLVLDRNNLVAYLSSAMTPKLQDRLGRVIQMSPGEYLGLVAVRAKLVAFLAVEEF